MNDHLENLKNKLLEIYSNPNLTPDDLYEFLICKQSTENIYSKYNLLLNNLYLYLYYKHNLLQSLTKNTLPFEITRNLSFDLFCNELEKYKLYKFDSIFPNDNYYNLITRSLVNHNKIIEDSNWKFIQKNALENTNDNENFAYKIYLPIANQSLELFTMKFLAKCHRDKINYDFKINNNEGLTRSDNVVIYATSNNINNYLKIIGETIRQNQNIIINYDYQHPLAYPYNNYISIAPYLDYNKESFSSIICKYILKSRETTSSFEDFYNKVVTFLNQNVYNNKDNIDKKI